MSASAGSVQLSEPRPPQAPDRPDTAEKPACAALYGLLQTFAASAAVQAPVCAWRPLRATPRPAHLYVPQWQTARQFTAARDYLHQYLAFWFEPVQAHQRFSAEQTVPTWRQQRQDRQFEQRRLAQWQRKWRQIERMQAEGRLTWSEATFDIDNDDVREPLLRLDRDNCARDAGFENPGLFPRVAAIAASGTAPLPLRHQRLEIGWASEDVFAYQGITYALTMRDVVPGLEGGKPDAVQQAFTVHRLSRDMSVEDSVFNHVAGNVALCTFIVSR